MNLAYRKATPAELELLVRARLEVLRSANRLPPDAALPEVEQQSRDYFKQALTDGTCAAYFAFDGDTLAGTGGVSYFRVMPTCHIPTGRKAYLMNLYTNPAYRRQGIATKMLELLVADAHSRGVTFISLEATDMGRPLYEKFGFVKMENEMELGKGEESEQ